MKEVINGFKTFILKGNVVDLAVGIIIGASFGAVVNAMVKDLITPLIGALGGTPDFSAWHFTINNSKFLIGDFINAFIAFLINAAVIYFFVVTPMNKMLSRIKPDKEVNVRQCPECLSEVPKAARKCMYCTSALPKTSKKSE